VPEALQNFLTGNFYKNFTEVLNTYFCFISLQTFRTSTFPKSGRPGSQGEGVKPRPWGDHPLTSDPGQGLPERLALPNPTSQSD